MEEYLAKPKGRLKFWWYYYAYASFIIIGLGSTFAFIVNDFLLYFFSVGIGLLLYIAAEIVAKRQIARGREEHYGGR